MSKKKSKIWVCDYKCNPKLGPCKHLQKLLPSLSKGSLGKSTLEEIADDWYALDTANYDYTQIDHVKASLKKVGLNMDQINLLLDKYVYGLQLTEIAKRSGYVSSSAVAYLLKHTISQLKRIGLPNLEILFKKELE